MAENDEPVIHYCWVCDTEEVCKEEKCDFRELTKCHGFCMAKVRRKDEDFKVLLDQNKRLLEQNERLITYLEKKFNAKS